MTTAEWVTLLDARPVGKDRYRACCPNGKFHRHNDRNPSLDVAAGRDGRTLLICRTGCRIEDIVQAVGLHMRDLFPAPLSPKQAREAQRQRQIAKAEAKARRRERRALADKYRKLNELQRDIAARLAALVFHPEDESANMSATDEMEADALAVVYHATLDRVRVIEAVYEQQEAREFHARTLLFCEKHHIDYQKLLAPYMDQREDTEAAEASR